MIKNSFLINRTPFKISQEESIFISSNSLNYDIKAPKTETKVIKFKNDIILKDIITKTVPITDKKQILLI